MNSSETGLFVKGFIETSFVDWPGRIASVIFLPGCNFRCGWCHNRTLVLHPDTLENVTLTHVLKRMQALQTWVDGVVVTGGEPTVSPALPAILRRFADAGIPVKLDTNGARPDVLHRLISENLLTGVSMDIKTVPDSTRYREITGVPVDINTIDASIRLILHSGLWYEFRTTLLPGLHTPADVHAMTRWLEKIAAQTETAKETARDSGENPPPVRLQRPLKLQGFKPHPDLPEPWRSMPEVNPEEYRVSIAE